MTKLPAPFWRTFLSRLLLLFTVAVLGLQADRVLAQTEIGVAVCDYDAPPQEYLDTGDTTSGSLSGGLSILDDGSGTCDNVGTDPSELAAAQLSLDYDTGADRYDTRIEVFYEGSLIETITGCGTGGSAGSMLTNGTASCQAVVPTDDGRQISVETTFVAYVSADYLGTYDRVAVEIQRTFLRLETRAAPTTLLLGDLNDLNTQSEALITVQFGAPVTGFEATDIELDNLAIEAFSGGDTNYSVTVSALADGPASFQVPAGVAEGAGLANLAATPLTATLTAVPPRVLSVTGDPMEALTGGTGTYTATITFSEPVTPTDGAAVTATGATIAGLAPGPGCATGAACAVWQPTVTVTEAALFDHELTVDQTAFEDLTGRAGSGLFPFRPTAQGNAPQVTVTGLPTRVEGPGTATLTFDWDQEVVGFTASDIQVTGGSLSGLSGGPAQWTATLSIAGTSEVGVQVPAGAVRATGGRPSLAAGATVPLDSARIASRQIRRFMEHRARALLSSQPPLRGLLDRSAPSGAMAFRDGLGRVDLHSGGRGPVWMALKGQWSRLGDSDLNYALLTLGAHHRLSEDLLIGAMVEIDRARATQGTARVEGTGWLAGPYFAMRLAEGQLTFDGRLLYGESRNTITPVGTFTDDFSTERWLATLSLSGEIERGDLTLLPYLEHGWTWDRQRAYRDSLGQVVPEQTVSLRETAVGLDLRMALERDLSVTAGIAAIASDLSGAGGSSTRGRVSLGGRKTWPNGLTLEVGSFYDGLWDAGYESFGLDVSLSIAF